MIARVREELSAANYHPSREQDAHRASTTGKELSMNSNHPATRDERRKELMTLWARGRAGQAVVLRLCHGALQGESLQAGMSIFDVILDHEFGKPADDSANLRRQSA